MKSLFVKIKKKWLNYLYRLAKTNEKQFGNQRLDCCSINREVKK